MTKKAQRMQLIPQARYWNRENDLKITLHSSVTFAWLCIGMFTWVCHSLRQTPKILNVSAPTTTWNRGLHIKSPENTDTKIGDFDLEQNRLHVGMNTHLVCHRSFEDALDPISSHVHENPSSNPLSPPVQPVPFRDLTPEHCPLNWTTAKTTYPP